MNLNYELCHFLVLIETLSFNFPQSSRIPPVLFPADLLGKVDHTKLVRKKKNKLKFSIVYATILSNAVYQYARHGISQGGTLVICEAQV